MMTIAAALGARRCDYEAGGHYLRLDTPFMTCHAYALHEIDWQQVTSDELRKPFFIFLPTSRRELRITT